LDDLGNLLGQERLACVLLVLEVLGLLELFLQVPSLLLLLLLKLGVDLCGGFGRLDRRL
jgi:hypothetical protein